MTIETQETPTTPTEAVPEAFPSRDELIAAVREAGGTESVDVEAEAAVAHGGEPAVETPAEEEPRIQTLLRAREKAAAEREAARNEADEFRARAREEADRIIAEAREQSKREAEEDRERRKAAFRANPSAHLRELGDPKEIAETVLREGSPEAREIAELRERLAKTEKKADVGEDVRKQLEDFRTQQAEEKRQAQIDQAKATFMTHASAEKAPYLNARYDQEEIVLKASKQSLEWQKGGLKLGTDFDYDDLVQYLEMDSKKRISPLGVTTPAQQSSAGAPAAVAAKEPGNAPKSSANGPRTLSAAQGSERRTSPKPIREMSPAEARDALIEEVAAARRANPDAVM